VEVARGEEPWTERVAQTESESFEIDDVRNDGRGDAERREHLFEEARRHDVVIDAPQRRARDRRSLEVIGRFAAAVVENHRTAEPQAWPAAARAGRKHMMRRIRERCRRARARERAAARRSTR